MRGTRSSILICTFFAIFCESLSVVLPLNSTRQIQNNETNAGGTDFFPFGIAVQKGVNKMKAVDEFAKLYSVLVFPRGGPTEETEHNQSIALRFANFNKYRPKDPVCYLMMNKNRKWWEWQPPYTEELPQDQPIMDLAMDWQWDSRSVHMVITLPEAAQLKADEGYPGPWTQIHIFRPHLHDLAYQMYYIFTLTDPHRSTIAVGARTREVKNITLSDIQTTPPATPAS